MMASDEELGTASKKLDLVAPDEAQEISPMPKPPKPSSTRALPDMSGFPDSTMAERITQSGSDPAALCSLLRTKTTTSAQRLTLPPSIKQERKNKAMMAGHHSTRTSTPVALTWKKKSKRISSTDFEKEGPPIGRGTFGEVFVVTYNGNGKRYALKECSQRSPLTKDSEIQSVSLLGSHPNIVQVYSYWEAGNTLNILMELCPEGNLKTYHLKHLSKHKPGEPGYYLSPSVVLGFMRDILRALFHIHSKNLLHLDIKLENCLIANGAVKLGDFGNSCQIRSKNKTEGDSAYMAPELLNNSDTVTPAADMFSLGISIMELAYNVEIPTRGPLWCALRSGWSFPAAPLGWPHSWQFEHVMSSLLSPDPSSRPSAAALLESDLFRRF
ncbi:membrane-associated tyrosine- and threonine-specific cdc2-inhibitory kinase [Pelomyxa schiedti]|nr:membrane-associated tyrosine- and threonine-specific cdc2-inhibitory kinase [Pelomyxa schiedti]